MAERVEKGVSGPDGEKKFLGLKLEENVISNLNQRGPWRSGGRRWNKMREARSEEEPQMCHSYM